MRFTDHSYSNWLFDLFFVVFLHESCDFTLLFPPVHLFVTWLRCDLKGGDLSEVVSHRSLSSHDVRSSVPRALSANWAIVVSDVGMWAWFPEKAVWLSPKRGQSIHKLRQKALIHFIWQNRMGNTSKLFRYRDTPLAKKRRYTVPICIPTSKEVHWQTLTFEFWCQRTNQSHLHQENCRI